METHKTKGFKVKSPQSKKLTNTEKFELEHLVRNKIESLKNYQKVMNEVETEHTETLNDLILKEVETLDTILQKLQ